jgi:hypothetical protein
MTRAMTSTQLAASQGLYFTTTGIWPLLHLRSFEAVTGPKVDKWLVKTVGVLIAAIGCSLLSAGIRKRVAPETRLLGMSSAAALAGIDVLYAGRGRIRRIYLLDAVAELGLIALWLRVPKALGR